MLNQLPGADYSEKLHFRNDNYIRNLAEENRNFVIRFALDGLFKVLVNPFLDKPKLVKEYLKDYKNFMLGIKKMMMTFFLVRLFLNFLNRIIVNIRVIGKKMRFLRLMNSEVLINQKLKLLRIKKLFFSRIIFRLNLNWAT